MLAAHQGWPVIGGQQHTSLNMSPLEADKKVAFYTSLQKIYYNYDVQHNTLKQHSLIDFL